ncbi:MAG: hypothetical protein JRI23_25630 [Deltaproteobacteria bacterium]|jgi:hypothetical protein|nr:hypothetical protein [Deltaproteobacteria bacterium]MBW2535409.1 hypothetical protein [Deltaproteobacteria bacterium]
MRIIIKTRGHAVPEGLREMVRRRAHLALGRFADEIARVVVTLDAGDSSSCQVSVRGRTLWQVLVRDEDGWPGSAAIHALDRAARDVARRFDRTIGQAHQPLRLRPPASAEGPQMPLSPSAVGVR